MAGSGHKFRIGQNNVYQVLLSRPSGRESGLPLTRSDWYAGDMPLGAGKEGNTHG
jgi:cyclopropane-fatty-acyl-phospholipid synthase